MVPAPADQKPGFYALLAGASADFSTEDNQVSATTLWVSPLALITRQAPVGAEGFAVSYTPLTLPTNREVSLSVGGVSVKTNISVYSIAIASP